MRQKIKIMKNSKGFTLLELLVGVAIIGILVGLATSYLSTPRLRLKSAARDIMSSIKLTKAKALEKGGKWAVQFDTDVPEIAAYRIIINKDNYEWNSADIDEYKMTYLSNYPGISFGSGHSTVSIGGSSKHTGDTDIADGVSAPDNRFIFNPDGTTNSQGMVYLKTKKGETIAIGIISAVGMMKTWVNYGSGWEE